MAGRMQAGVCLLIQTRVGEISEDDDDDRDEMENDDPSKIQ